MKNTPIWIIYLLLCLTLGAVKTANPLVPGLLLITGGIILAISVIRARLFTQQQCLEGALSLFVFSAVIGVWVSYDYRLSLPTLLAIIGSIVIYFAITRSQAVVDWSVYGLVVLGSLLALYFVSQFGHLDYQDEVGVIASAGQYIGTFVPSLVIFKPHPNAVATFLEGGFLLGLMLTVKSRSSLRLLWGSLTLVMAAGLLISGSRGAWLGLLVALGLGIFLQASNRVRVWIGATAGFLAGMIIAIVSIQVFVLPGQLPLSPGSAFDSGGSRLVLYENSLYLLNDYLLTGLGLGEAFAMVYSRYQLLISVPYLYYAHNLLLSVWLGQGILGVLALAILFVAFYSFVYRVEKVGRLSTTRLSLFRAAWLGVTTSLVHGFIDSAQFSEAYWTMPVLFALLGIAVATGRPVPEMETPISFQKRFHWKSPQFLVIAILTIGVLVVWAKPVASIWQLNMGAVNQTRADLAPYLSEWEREIITLKSERQLKQSLLFSPTQYVAHKRLGLLTLNRFNFNDARYHLEQSYSIEPANQAGLKGLGYAYLWTEQPDSAEALFTQVDFRSRLIEEFDYWNWWWGTQDRDDLAQNAFDMARRLRGN